MRKRIYFYILMLVISLFDLISGFVMGSYSEAVGFIRHGYLSFFLDLSLCFASYKQYVCGFISNYLTTLFAVLAIVFIALIVSEYKKGKKSAISN